MKKNILFISVLLCFILGGITNISAKDLNKNYCADKTDYACIICSYTINQETKSYAYMYAYSSGDGNVKSISDFETSSAYIKGKFNNIASTNFIDKNNNRLMCPKLAVNLGGQGRDAVYTMSFSNEEGVTAEAINNNKPLTNTEKPSISCSYSNGISIWSDGEKTDIQSANYQVMNSDVSAADFKSSSNLVCPTYYVTCTTRGTKMCSITKTSQGGASQENEGVQNQTGTDIAEGTYPGGKLPYEYEGIVIEKTCEGLLGNGEFLQMLKDIFNYIQVLGPLLALVLGMVDFAKAAMSGEDDAKKKALKDVKNRLIAAFLLFLIPFILKMLLNLAPGLSGDCNLGSW